MKWLELDAETRERASQTLLTLGTMLYEWGVPLDKSLHGIRCAYEIAQLPTPCTCHGERDKELCQRKAKCAEVRAFEQNAAGQQNPAAQDTLNRESVAVAWGPPIPLPDGTYYRIGSSTGAAMPEQPAAGPADVREALEALVAAVEMADHNDQIFSGKWKKGAKAWSGEFVEKETRKAMEKTRAALSALPPARTLSEEEIGEIALQACDKAAYMNTEAHIKAVEDAIRTALERLKA